MASLKIHGQEIFVRSEGAGPALVFLHGFLADHRMWAPQLTAFALNYRVVTWDAPGCGQSSDPPEDFKFADYSLCLEGVMDALCIPDAHLIGLSWGGALAIHFAATRSARVRSTTLVDTYLGWLGTFGEAVARQRLSTCLADSELSGAELAAKWTPGLISPHADEKVAGRVREVLSAFHSSGFRNHARTLAQSDLRGELARLRRPLLLIWGEQDQRSPPELAQHFQKLAPHARLALIPGAGHLPNLERPEQFNNALAEFLASG